MRFFVCDSCGFKKPEGESNEYIPIGETLEMKVIKANTNENTQDNTKDTTEQ
jgi:predicted metal-binding protein